jgi:hypothetical protein
MRTSPFFQSFLLITSSLILLALCAHGQTFSVQGIEGYKQANDLEGMRNYRDPRYPNVFHNNSTAWVAVEDWRWNEEALKNGADVMIPD